VRARTACDKDVFALQQRLLSEAASESLMAAARGLLQPENYEAVVEERGLEGLCGYPPCSNAALGDQGKKYSMNVNDGTVDKICSTGNFCSVACRRASATFVVSLEPEPSYVRPEAAVVASRAAIAGENIAMKETAPCQETKQTKMEDIQIKSAPKIRQKAVVKFSRVNQTYTVQCDEYDGGGGIPGLPSAECDDVSKKQESVRGGSCENRREWMQRIVSTPIVEREDTHTTQSVIASAVVNTNESLVESGSHLIQSQTGASSGSSLRCSVTSADSLAVSGTGHSVAEKTASPSEDLSAKSREAQRVDETNDDDCNNDMFGAFEPLEFPFEILPKSVVVRAWGVLSSWMHERARDALWRGIAPDCNEQDERPDHMTRHQLLSDVLLQRVPGDLAFIAPRFLQVVSALQLHETLPPVTDALLYDLLAALILRAVLRADVSRKIRPYYQRDETISCRQVEDAAAQCGMQDDELRWLEKQLDFLYWS